ncbi:methanogenic corrinoid protein MtbC1 [Desulfosalsimonas propionicica]|uniref:Methanogenic corrinoid protein MtbC1 n=1 Tax=Desulfosalsimonas propionicica TaxID=332175 RepID=A0A7W0HL86_9BACT|nr:cobalamin-dependent protein [Desulfosalsimonas propionicica]MBA2882020.1 methanogenic corrinoid protein MtbC1 [Desulfosalsimonas propionicica]
MDTDLKEEISRLPEVPPDAAMAYKQHLGEMVEKVNNRMRRRPELDLLIGGNPVSMMFDNHRNHGLFMSNVFSLNEYALLLNTIPWVYRAYTGRGFSFNYFPAHLQTWRDVLEETLAPDSAACLDAVYGWMISRHEKFIQLSKQSHDRTMEPDAQWRPVYEQFLQGLLSADRQASMAVAKKAVPDLARLNDFYIHVVQPAMYAVGAMWERGEISVAKEHLASALVNRVMAVQYIELMESPEQSKGKAVVTATANEFHEIGAAMVANALEADGWEITFLGANTPSEELLEYVSASGFDLVCVSITVPFNLESIQNVIQAIRTWPEGRQPKIMIGGQAFGGYPELPQKLGADGFAENPEQAVALADQWGKAIC